MNRPPRPLAILIYGNSSSTAISAVSNDDYRKTMTEVGHVVSRCASPASCSQALREKHYDVVLADPSDAAHLKLAGGLSVVPVMNKPSKDYLSKTKEEFGQAFDASRGSLRLLSVLNAAAKERH